MLKKLAAIGLGAALILSPMATMAQTSTDTTAAAPAADTMKPAPKKPVHKAKAKHVTKKPVHKAKAKHVMKKPMAKKPAPAPAAEAPKS